MQTSDYRRVMRAAHRRLAQEPLESRTLLSVSPTLIDLDSATYSNPTDFVQIGDLLYFVAETTDEGRELWVTDGTEDGTSLVKDICDGTGSSDPSDLVGFDGELYFVADDGEHGAELWKSDGTSSGTVLVKDIYTGTYTDDYGTYPNASIPTDLVVVGDVLYFSAMDGDCGAELWMSDGTEDGTVMVKDIYTGSYTGSYTDSYGTYPNSSDPVALVNVDGTLFFVAEDADAGLELWTSDGTSNGTVMVADINDGSGSAFDRDGVTLVAVDDTLFLVASDGSNGYELWTSDGTESGTSMVADIASGSDDAFTIGSVQAIALDGVLYFGANDGDSGDELWRSDGTENGTYLLKDITDGADGTLSDYTSFTVLGDLLYFSADDGSTGKELWVTDGTESGTVLVKDINSGSSASYPYYMKAVDGILYFSAKTDDKGRELWMTDGTEDSTVLVDDTVDGSTGLYPRYLETINGYLLFGGYIDSGRELYSFDLDAAGYDSASLIIWVDGEQIEIDAEIGVYSNGTTASVYTTDDDGEITFAAGDGTTLDDFFTIWRTDAGEAGDNDDATFDAHELMGNASNASYTVQMFVNGYVCTDFEDYAIEDGDEIILIYTDNPVVSLVTNYGSIVVELYETETPITVENFLTYVNDGDYLDSIFHRSDPGFVIQGGGYTTDSETFTDTSQFTSITSNGTIENEATISNLTGTIAMARSSDVDSATSQFYINLADNTSLDSSSSTAYDGYTVFGMVLCMTTVTTIEALPVDDSNSSPFAELPYSDDDVLVVIESIEGVGDITGYKFLDEDADGVFDSSEEGIAGVVVFLDADEDGVLDDGEIWATTDADGKYLLQAETGTYTVCAQVSSGSIATVASDEATVEIGVATTSVNLGETALTAPTAVNLLTTSDTGSSDEDDLTNLNNADEDSTLQFLVTGITSGATVSLYCDGTLIGTATASSTTVTVTTDGQTELSDGEHDFTATQTLDDSESDASDALTVTIDTEPPAAIASTAPAVAEILVEYTFDADSPDEGEDGITYSLVDAPDGMTIDEETGEITWTPTADQDVPQLFQIVVSDAAGNTSAQTVDMTVLGVIPAYPDSYEVNEDAVLTVDEDSGVLVNDDPDDDFGDLTVSIVNEPEHGTVTLSDDGSFTYTPDEDYFGTDSFTYEATDGTDESNEAKVTITVVGVQDAPVGADDTYTADEDEVLTIDAADGVLANDSDVDGDALTATLDDEPSHGTLVLNSDGSFTYTPDDEYSGTDSFTYVLSDGTNTTDPITVTITIENVNDAPVGEADSYTMDEDEALTVDATDGVLANDTDEEGDDLTVTLVDDPSNGSVTLNDDGSFTYAPDDDFAGTDTFTYTISDGTNTSDEVTVTITVENVSDDPVAEDDEFDVENDSSTHTLDVLDNDSDPDDSDTMTITAVTQGSEGGTVSISDDEILYTPADDFTGTETFTYTIEDEDGNESTATVTMTVTAEDDTSDQETGTSSLYGYVYLDKDGDGQRDDDELGVPGVLITLSGTSDNDNDISYTCLTDDDGYYLFDNLPAGTYALTEGQPTIVVDGEDSTDVDDATVEDDEISEIVLASGESLGETNFGEAGIKSSFITIRMFLASTPPMEEYLRELVAYGEECAGNDDLAEDIRNGETDYTPDDETPVAEDDAYTVEENTTLSIDADEGVLANDTDPDDDDLEAVLVDDVENGTLTLDDDGSFTYVPDTNFAGTDTFTYYATDGTYHSDTVTVTITVSEGNDAPVAVADSYTTDEDETLTVDAEDGLLANDMDGDEDDLEAVLVTDATNGTLTIEDDGSFTYVPDADFSGADTFTYYVTDGELESDTVTVTITVTAINDAPVAVADTYEVDENTTLTIDADEGVLANDTDADDDALEAVLVDEPKYGTLTLDDGGSFTYVPDTNYAGTDTFTYYTTDGTEDSDEVTVTITITEGNDAPVVAADAYTTDEDTALSIDAAEGVLANDTDADADTLEVVLVDDVTHGTLALEDDGSFTYTPDENYYGTDAFTYYATDGSLDSDEVTVTITISAVNDAPVGAADAYTVVVEGTLTVDAAEGVLANDTDVEGDSLSTTLVTGPANGTLTLNGDGSFTYTPATGFHGIDTFTYTAGDGSLDSDTVTVTIAVNSPADAADDAYEVNEDGVLTVEAAGGLLLNDSDVDGDSLTVALVTGPEHGTLTLNADGSFTYAPEADYHGTDTFTYVAEDGYGQSAAATVTITVNAVNDAPVGAADVYTAAENTTLTIGATSGVLANDTDVDGDSLAAVLVEGPTHGTVTLSSDGSFEYVPAADFVGTDTFTYQATDGLLASEAITVSITVEEGNDTPVAVADAYTVAVNGGLSVAATAGVLANDTDADGDTLTASLASGPSHGTLTLNADGSFTYAPETDYHGTDTFTYTVSDGVLTSAETTVTIEVNSPAEVVEDAYSVAEDGDLVVDAASGVLLNDADMDGDALAATVVSEPEHGTLVLYADGSFTYTPNADFSGTDTFTYAASDGYSYPTAATVTITVNPVNDSPTTAEDLYTVAVDGAMTVEAADGVLANDTDVDGDTLTASLASGPSHGTLTFNADGSFTYAPEADYHGTDTFTYTVSDGTVASAEATTVTIDVNDPAEAVADAYAVDEDGQLVVDAASGVLANDSDPDPDTLTATLVTGPEHGTLVLNEDGSFTYTPNANFSGTDTFTYAAVDGYLNPAEATVTITVNAVNDTPATTEDAYTVAVGGVLTIDEAAGVLANDSDADGDTLTATVASGPSHGTLTLNGDSSFTYTPESDYHGTDTFTYTVSDGELTSAETTVTITVNSPAIGVADGYSVVENETLTIDAALGVLANDTDEDEDSLAAALVSGPEHGTLVLNADGSFTYTPNEDYTGDDTFTYAVTDGYGETANAVVTIAVDEALAEEDNWLA